MLQAIGRYEILDGHSLDRTQIWLGTSTTLLIFFFKNSRNYPILGLDQKDSFVDDLCFKERLGQFLKKRKKAQ